MLKKIKGQDRLLFILCVVVLSVLILFVCTGIFITIASLSDVDAEVRYALEIIRSGEIFPSEYTTGPDVWVYARNMAMAPILLFTDDLLFAFSAASIIMLMPAVLSVIYCSRKIMKNNTWLIAIPLLFCGIGYDWYLMYTSTSSYMAQFLSLILVITLYIDSVDENYKIKSKIKFIFLVILILYMGLGGGRGLQVYGVPLVGTIVISFLYKYINDSFYDSLKKSEKMLSIAIPLGVAMIVSFLGSQLLLKRMNCPSENASIYFSDLDFFQRIEDLYNTFMLICGITSNVPMLSVNGVLNLLKITGGIILYILLPILQIKNLKNESNEMKLFSIYACIHLLEMILIAIFTNALTAIAPRYLLTTMYILIFLAAHYLYKIICSKPDKSLIKVMINVCFSMYVLICSASMASSCMNYDEKIAQRKDLTNYLKSEELTWGYASYWNAGSNSLLSNREVNIEAVIIWDNLTASHWLNSKYNYTPEAYQGPSFLMIDDAENEIFTTGNAYAALGEPYRILNYGGFWIYVYDYNISINNFEGKEALS
ncbi:MAG: hypothetical protein K2K57_14640 [Oscillospiraceae bacterium]|nr:hypothetical protein [Oscillospiraceae bacterium]